MKTTVKKLLLTLFAIMLFAVMFCYNASALEATGQCGDNVYWNYNEATGELVISGNGDMEDYSYPYSPFYTTDIKSVVIESGVTSIGSHAFEACTSLASVTIPYSVTTIGGGTFEDCSSLKSITFPDGVTSIGECAFFCCTSLESVTIPDSVTWIGLSAFSGCTSLESITIPDSVTSIGRSAFSGCTNLKSVTIGKGVKRIEDFVFEDCTSLESITIPDSVTSIGGSAFSGCRSLESVTIGNGVTSIGEDAFYNCNSIEKVYINSIEAWCNIDFLKSNSNPLYYGVDIYLNEELLTDLFIPDSVTYINCAVFDGCTSLESVTIPDGVTSIDSSAFSGCSSLKSVIIPDSVTSIGSSAFSGCTSLESVTIPYGVTRLGFGAFQRCTSLESVIIPDSVTSIGDYAFFSCSSLESVTIPDSVISIGEFSFYEQLILCPKNSYAHTWSQANNIPFAFTDGTDEENVLSGSFGKFSWTLDKRTGVLQINGSGTLPNFGSIGAPWKDYKNGVLKIIYSEGFTEIGTGFSSYPLLRAVVIPNTVTSIGKDEFSNCNSIERVYINDIESWCNIYFSKANSNPLWYEADLYLNGEIVTNLIIPDSIKSIGSYAFYNCKSLASVIIPNNVTSIGSYAFSDCTSLKSVKIGNCVTNIGYSAFEDCTGLEELTIPYSVKSIGSNAFPPSLKDVMIYSRECTFARDCGLTYNQTIYGFKGSTAEVLADEIGANFIDIETVHSHKEEIVLGKSATCTEKGLTEGKKCSEPACSKVITVQTEIPASGHSYKAIITAPTCTAEGYTTYTCSCGDTYVADKINALTHKDDDKDYKCDYSCGYEFSKSEPTTIPTTQPTTTAPTTTAPATTQPITQAPTTEAPTTTKPVESTTQPTAAESTTVPSTTAPATQAPAVTEPVTQPTNAKPVESTTQPTVAEPTTKPSEESTTVHTHTEVTIPAVPATYTKSGKTEGKKCSICGEIIVAQKKVARKKLKKVTSLKAKKTTASSVTLSWKKVTGAESYKVYYSTNGKKWKSVKATKNSVTVKKLNSAKNYQFKVKAVAGKYYGEVSKVVKSTTKFTTASLSKVKSTKAKTAAVTWKKVTDASGYIVEYSTSKKFTKKTTKTVKIKKGITIKTTLKKLKSGKKYYVRIRAYKTVSKKTVYGSYSSVKTVKIK